jgi:PIN domain nuclease of toxin-antitoxin system
LEFALTTVLLDTHVLHWWTATPEVLTAAARTAVDSADELAVASISWYELAWLAHRDRIRVTVPIRAWLERLAAQVRTIPSTPAVALAAVLLPGSFPGDPADRLIYATAQEYGIPLVTGDEQMRQHRQPGVVTVW